MKPPRLPHEHMNLGLISDIHDNVPGMCAALEQLAAAGCSCLLCLGDIASVSTLRRLRESWQGELHLVAGNNDYPRADFSAAAAAMPHTHYHGDTAELTLGGRRIFMAHEPERTLSAARFGSFDAIFFGHTHRAGQLQEGGALIANPGEVQGRYGHPSVAVYDTATHTLRHLSL